MTLNLSRSKFLRRSALGFFSLLLASTVVACGGGGDVASDGGSEGASDSNVLVVATEPAYPPFESQAEGGGYEGFDIDLFNAVGEVAGLEIQFESLPFDGIIPALQAGTVGAAISAMTITAERAETVDFSRPYFKAGLAIAVEADNEEITSFEDLVGKRIAVQIGTTGAAEAEKVEGAEVVTFESTPLALQELSNGNADAVIGDLPVALYAIDEGGLDTVKVVGDLLTEEFYGIALPQGSENLAKINEGIAAIIADGTYGEIYKKWFDAEAPTDLPESAL